MGATGSIVIWIVLQKQGKKDTHKKELDHHAAPGAGCSGALQDDIDGIFEAELARMLRARDSLEATFRVGLMRLSNKKK